MRRRLPLAIVTLVLSSCTPASTAPPAPRPAATATAAPATASTPSPATATAASAVAPAPETAGLTGVLQPIATTTNLYALSFLGWQHGMPVITQNGWGPKVMCGADESGRYILDERFWQGVDTTVLVEAAGDFAGDALLMGFSDTGRGVGEGVLFARKGGGRWKAQKTLPFLEYFSGVHAWSNGRTLAMIHQGGLWRPQPKAPRFEIVGGPRGGSDVPVLALEQKHSESGQKYLGAVVDPTLMVAFTSGHVYAIGTESLEWFAPGQAKGTIVSASGGLSTEHSYAKHGERTLYLADRQRISKIDGDHIEPIAVPAEPPSRGYDAHVAVTDDGVLWFAHAGGPLYRREPGGNWTQIAIPLADGMPDGSYDVVALAARGNNVWTAAKARGGDTSRIVVAWNGPRPAELSRIDLPGDSWGPVQIATEDLERPKPAAEGCDTVFALFYGITKYAAPDYDFPKAREALKGKPKFATARFVKTEVRGQQFFGAFTKDLAQGRELIALITKEVEGSTPQLLCHKPHVVAELGIDFATGASKGWKAAQ